MLIPANNISNYIVLRQIKYFRNTKKSGRNISPFLRVVMLTSLLPPGNITQCYPSTTLEILCRFKTTLYCVTEEIRTNEPTKLRTHKPFFKVFDVSINKKRVHFRMNIFHLDLISIKMTSLWNLDLVAESFNLEIHKEL